MPGDGLSRVHFALAAAAALTACSSDTLSDQQAAPVTLAGEWRVVAVDGEAIEPPFTLSASDQTLRWEPACAQLLFRYAIDGPRFRAERVLYAELPSPQGTPAAPPCAIGLPAGLEDAMAAMLASRRIELVQGGLHVAGGGHSLTLTSR